MQEDAELLRRYLDDRSEAAFAELVRRHLNVVYSAALRRVGGDVHLAEDVSQKVFIELARRASSLRTHRSLTGWLYTVSRYVAVRVVRAERRRSVREQKASLLNESTMSPETVPDWEQLRPFLDEALDRLKERDREALLLRFFEDQPFASVGLKLNVSEDGARKCVDRALDRLRALLAKRGIASTASAMALLLSTHAATAAPPALASSIEGAALAAGSTGGIVLLSRIFDFMSTSKTTAVAAGALLVLAAGIAVFELTEQKTTTRTLAVAKRDYDARAKTERDLTGRLRREQERLSEAKKDRDMQPKPVLPVPSAASDGWDPVKEGKAFLSRHPEVKEALVARSDAAWNLRFGSFFASLGYTPRQLEDVRALMRGLDMFGGAPVAGAKYLVLPVGAAWPDPEVEKRLRDYMGEEDYRRREAFGKTVFARDFASQVASALCFTDAPLSSSQAERLVPIMAGHRTKKRADQVSGFDWDAIIPLASDFLSEPQQRVLEGMRAQDLYRVATTTIVQSGPTPAAKGAPAKGKP